jgi:phosphoserine phosphatase
MTVEKLHHEAFDQILVGLSLKELEKHVDELLSQLFPQFLYLPAYQELIRAQKKGDHIVLFSSSPDFLVKRFAAYFGISTWEATVFGVDKEQCLCKIAKLMAGREKERCLLKLQKQLGIHKNQVIVYTDSYDDLPLLLQAGEAIVVNPDRKLARMAKMNGWRMI